MSDAVHAEWCNLNVNECGPSCNCVCDCGGNGGACPYCGAEGPCGFTSDGVPLICKAPA